MSYTLSPSVDFRVSHGILYIIISFFGKNKKTYRASSKPFYSGVSLRRVILSNRAEVNKKTESFPFRNIATLLIIF